MNILIALRSMPVKVGYIARSDAVHVQITVIRMNQFICGDTVSFSRVQKQLSIRKNTIYILPRLHRRYIYTRHCERQPEQISSPYVKAIGDASVKVARPQQSSNPTAKTFAERRRKRHHEGVSDVDLLLFKISNQTSWQRNE